MYSYFLEIHCSHPSDQTGWTSVVLVYSRLWSVVKASSICTTAPLWELQAPGPGQTMVLRLCTGFLLSVPGLFLHGNLSIRQGLLHQCDVLMQYQNTAGRYSAQELKNITAFGSCSNQFSWINRLKLEAKHQEENNFRTASPLHTLLTKTPIISNCGLHRSVLHTCHKKGLCRNTSQEFPTSLLEKFFPFGH